MRRRFIGLIAATVASAVLPLGGIGASASPTDAPERGVEPVILTGADLPGWSGPAADGSPKPYPSGAMDGVRDAHNGVMVVPPKETWSTIDPDAVVAYSFHKGSWQEIPVQVDERFPYFLANANSDFGIYSGTDKELSYEWDVESWLKTAGECYAQYPEGVTRTEDPVLTLDDDDEVVFMASDAGERAPADSPAGTARRLEVRIDDPFRPGEARYVYLFTRDGGPAFDESNGYVRYERDAEADRWIDKDVFAEDDPEKLGTSNRGYGPNLSGTVCEEQIDPATGATVLVPRNSDDRFPRDGVTVTTGTYIWKATGRWMVREIHVARPGAKTKGGRPENPGNGHRPENPGQGHSPDKPGNGPKPKDVTEDTTLEYGPDLIDRWKGRAFQQSPDSSISLVGFEDEQVNWEGNSVLLGELAGPVRAIREVWGADSGTNVTKTETFYRDAITYRYRVRVHPIPPDGLYTSWDYNHDAVSTYYNESLTEGVAIDGINDEIPQTNIDQRPVDNEPFFIDVPDPTFTKPLAFLNWEQVSGRGDNGSLVYIFEIKNAQALENPTVVPYYRDDACLDDGTGDNPSPRLWPGESYDWMNERGYTDYTERPCFTDPDAGAGPYRQGAFGSHGIHYFITGDTDNAFSPAPLTEIDGQQWQWMVPSRGPENVGDTYANTVKVPLVTTVVPQG
ncbi:MAG: hypothetical protein ACLGHL_02205 [Actinomycetota bacterium]